MGIQLECQYEEDLTKQPEARVRWYEAAGGTTLWEMTTDPVRARRVLRCRGAFTLSMGLVSHTRCRGWFRSASGPSRRVGETAFMKMA